MMCLKTVVRLCALSVVLVSGTSNSFAQGLVWTLPQDGTWVRYEGTFKQVESRPESTNTDEGDIEIDWIRQITIKSVGKEQVMIDGKETACRWIEIKTVTGKPSESGIDPGPTGAAIYKVLVPEARVLGQLEEAKIKNLAAGKIRDADTIPVHAIPIVKGFRKLGDSEILPVKAKILQVYPLLSFIRHFNTLTVDSEQAEALQIRLGDVSAVPLSGRHVMESLKSRSTNESKLWRSDDVPFGIAKWTVKIVREEKDSRASRDDYKIVTELNIEMAAHETGTDAVSELATPDE